MLHKLMRVSSLPMRANSPITKAKSFFMLSFSVSLNYRVKNSTKKYTTLYCISSAESIWIEESSC